MVIGGSGLTDPTSLLRTATRRAKSDVANKMISMFLHELSRRISRDWQMKTEGEAYAALVRDWFKNRCPYCGCDLTVCIPAVEHMDGMNRNRVGLHVPGNVIVSCKRCNSEKRRDDSRLVLTLAPTGWESFLSHDGMRCAANCATCNYWTALWPDPEERQKRLSTNLTVLRNFRAEFPELQLAVALHRDILPQLLAQLYADCQSFAETEIHSLLERFHNPSI